MSHTDGAPAPARDGSVYNIIPTDNLSGSHAALRFPEVRAAFRGLRTVSHLRWPSRYGGNTDDIFDWLQAVFYFQRGNVQNQREHLLLLLANLQMRLQSGSDQLSEEVSGKLCSKLTKNYKGYCSFVHATPNTRFNLRWGGAGEQQKQRLQLLYAALYLLIWGEAANLRFLPECLAYIFHKMAGEMNALLTDEVTAEVQQAEAYSRSYGFLERVVTPIYDTLKAEADSNSSGKLPHTAWRNYDDINEYFWSKQHPQKLKWPLDTTSSFFTTPEEVAKGRRRGGVGKTGFVEQRTALSLLRSFDRVWLLHALMLQVPPSSSPPLGGLPLSLPLRTSSSRETTETRDRETQSEGEGEAPFGLVDTGKGAYGGASAVAGGGGGGQVMCVVAFDADGRAPWTQLLDSADTRVKLLSCFITWAAMRAVFALLEVALQWRLVGRETLLAGVRMALKFLLAAAWIGFFTVLYGLMWAERHKEGRWAHAAASQLRVYEYAAAVFCIPQALGLLLFVVPGLSRAADSDWFPMPLLTWWFRTRVYVGRGLQEGVFSTLMYTLYWLLLLAGKFSFSYQFQVQPLVKPTRALLNLKDVRYKWPSFADGNYVAVGCIWAPIIVVYLMDMQIWYSVLSSVVGALVGLFQHIGEIHEVEFLISRFASLPKAVKFNLLVPNVAEPPPLRMRWLGIMQLRYNRLFGKRTRDEGVSTHFGRLWNDIIASFREEDLLSNREVEVLRMPAPNPAWELAVIQWPAVLLSNELLVAMEHARGWKGSSGALWRRVCAKEFRRCAVLEAYHSLKYVLRRIVARETERTMLECILETVDAAARSAATSALHRAKGNADFMRAFVPAHLPAVHARVLALVGQLLRKPAPQEARVEEALQALHQVVMRDFLAPRTRAALHSSPVFRGVRNAAASAAAAGGAGAAAAAPTPLYVDAVELPAEGEDAAFFRQLQRLQAILVGAHALRSTPANLEARRRISFFCNSCFMSLPTAPAVEAMRAFSVLTPYYSESVTFSKTELLRENEDGISTLFYLQKIYPDEWVNFEERVGVRERQQLYEVTDATELRLWASYRGQTLQRTVRGMMYYRRALELQAVLDSSGGDSALRDGFHELVDTLSGAASSSSPLRAPPSPPPAAAEESKAAQVSALVDMKFTYVVACQIYGQHKRDRDPRAADIQALMARHPALRVAYVDERMEARAGARQQLPVYYSVLVKWDAASAQEQEVYRVRLPGPMKLGEGKPENQNHALIFTRGEALQTIDMNQDNYLEEALKMRNLLQELARWRKPRILGVREHVFTGAVSSLAAFMSAQETAFVTLGQRVLANPLKVRMHYGHPDVFDRLWFITRGGISKASRVINISEDIYAGFNCTLRGGFITHHEYIQCGKGRDVGLNQTALFEAKVASGNGEQALSRDVYRLGHRLDFFRMLSFYYTSVGFFVCTLLTVLTVYAFLWGRCYLALSGIEDTVASQSVVVSDKALTAALNQQFLVQVRVCPPPPFCLFLRFAAARVPEEKSVKESSVCATHPPVHHPAPSALMLPPLLPGGWQVGLFTALPMLMELALEKGMAAALWEFCLMQLQLASVFFTFSLGTRTHYFGRTILHGGAKYRATGRGFVVRHEKFAENFRLYATSHFAKALELEVLLVVYMAYTSLRGGLPYFLLTFSAWFLALTWMMAPFVFNPSGFDWLKNLDDFKEWLTWLSFKGSSLVKEDQSWEVWWAAETGHLRTTGPWGLAAEAILSLRFFFFQYGVVYQLKIAGGNTSLLVYVLSWAYVVVALVAYAILTTARARLSEKKHLAYRTVQFAVLLCFCVLVGLALALTHFGLMDLIISAIAFLPTGWGILQLLQVASVVFPGLRHGPFWRLTTEVARFYAFVLGVIVWLPVAVLSFIPGLQDMQTRILFNQAFSRGLQIMRILVGKRPYAAA